MRKGAPMTAATNTMGDQQDNGLWGALAAGATAAGGLFAWLKLRAHIESNEAQKLWKALEEANEERKAETQALRERVRRLETDLDEAHEERHRLLEINGKQRVEIAALQVEVSGLRDETQALRLENESLRAKVTVLEAREPERGERGPCGPRGERGDRVPQG